MSYPPQPDPYGRQPGQYQGWNQQPGAYPQGNSPDDFWRQVAAGGGGGQPPIPPKKSNTGLIIGLVGGGIVALIVIVTVVAVIAINSGGKDPAPRPPIAQSSSSKPTTSDAPEADVVIGDCVSLASERGGPVEYATCGSPESDYEVVDVLEGKEQEACGDDYMDYDGKFTYCIALDVRAGDCLTSFKQEQEVLPLKIDCAGAEDQVSTVSSERDPKVACKPEEGYYSFSDRTVCFGNVKGA